MVRIYDIYGELIKEYPELDTLVGADLSYEDLEFADFRGMDLDNTDFHGASLYGAEFDSWVFDPANFDRPNFDDTYYEWIESSVGSGGSSAHFRGW